VADLSDFSHGVSGARELNKDSGYSLFLPLAFEVCDEFFY
jgi:hypothetical protein